MKFVSIDSSLANTGVAVGTIGPTGHIKVEQILLTETKKTKNKQVRASSDAIARCRQTHDFVSAVINQVKPALVFAETPSGSQSSSGMKSYGATCMLIASLKPAPIEVTPNEVKLYSTGILTASKTTMINWAHKLYPDLEWFYNKQSGELQNKNEHMADAIAIAYAAVKTDEFQRLHNMFKGL